VNQPAYIWLLVGALLGLTPGAVLGAALMRFVLRRPGD
jgi:hypothetical protein